jgi:hypothetical protein
VRPLLGALGGDPVERVEDAHVHVRHLLQFPPRLVPPPPPYVVAVVAG